jgi:hypothetical protein
VPQKPDLPAVVAEELTRSNSLTDLASRIKTEHAAVDAALKRSVEHAMSTGELLLEAKTQIKHGQWLKWLQENCGLSTRMAQNYMRLAEHRPEIETKCLNRCAFDDSTSFKSSRRA